MSIMLLMYERYQILIPVWKIVAVLIPMVLRVIEGILTTLWEAIIIKSQKFNSWRMSIVRPAYEPYQKIIAENNNVRCISLLFFFTHLLLYFCRCLMFFSPWTNWVVMCDWLLSKLNCELYARPIARITKVHSQLIQALLSCYMVIVPFFSQSCCISCSCSPYICFDWCQYLIMTSYSK